MASATALARSQTGIPPPGRCSSSIHSLQTLLLLHASRTSAVGGLERCSPCHHWAATTQSPRVAQIGSVASIRTATSAGDQHHDRDLRQHERLPRPNPRALTCIHAESSEAEALARHVPKNKVRDVRAEGRIFVRPSTKQSGPSNQPLMGGDHDWNDPRS